MPQRRYRIAFQALVASGQQRFDAGLRFRERACFTGIGGQDFLGPSLDPSPQLTRCIGGQLRQHQGLVGFKNGVQEPAATVVVERAEGSAKIGGDRAVEWNTKPIRFVARKRGSSLRTSGHRT
jgi:hypothetical protein